MRPQPALQPTFLHRHSRCKLHHLVGQVQLAHTEATRAIGTVSKERFGNDTGGTGESTDEWSKKSLHIDLAALQRGFSSAFAC